MMLRFLLILSVCGSAFGQVNTNWTLPIGIPMPPGKFGITNTHWQYHPDLGSKTFDYGSGQVPYRTNEFGPYTHYVDNTHPSAVDGTNTYGTPTVPRLTWVYPLPAGSVVQVKGGPYNFNNGESSTCRVGGNATSADDMIFLIGAHAPGADLSLWPVISDNELFVPGNWTGVEGILFTNNCSLLIRPALMGKPCTNIMVRSNYFWGTGAAGNPTAINSHSGSAANWTENLVALGNTARSYGNWTNATENDACMFIFGEWTTNIWVLDNEGYNLGGDGIRVGVNTEAITATPNLFGHYIGRNYFHDNGENSLDIKRANGVIYSQNRGSSYGNLTGGTSTGGTTMAIHYYPRNIWLLYNEHWGDGDGRGENRAVSGTSQHPGTHIYIIGNRLWNYAEETLHLDRVNGNWHVYNNLIANSHIGIYSGGSIESIDVKNNILFNITNQTLHVTDASVRSTAIVRNELHYPLSINWGGSLYTDWPTFLAAQSKGQDSLEVEPLFVNASTSNWDIVTTSPAKDAGFDVAAMEATLEAAFGFDADDQISLNVDADGTARPQNVTWDIGPSEFSAGESPEIGVTPASLSFGSVNIGNSSDLNFTVQNTGTGTLSWAVSGISAPFSVIGTGSGSLAASATATVTIRFTPVAVGAASDTASFTGGSGASRNVQGAGVAPASRIQAVKANVGTLTILP